MPDDYNNLVEKFSRFAAFEKPHIVSALKRVIREHHPSASELKILDFGCGPFEIGHQLIDLGQVDGYDLSETMIAAARRKLRAAGASSASAHVTSNLSTLRHNTHDVVLLSFVTPAISSPLGLTQLFAALRERCAGVVIMVTAAEPALLRKNRAFDYGLRSLPRDGEEIELTLIGPDGDITAELKDRYWSPTFLVDVALKEELKLKTTYYLGDIGSADHEPNETEMSRDPDNPSVYRFDVFA